MDGGSAMTLELGPPFGGALGLCVAGLALA